MDTAQNNDQNPINSSTQTDPQQPVSSVPNQAQPVQQPQSQAPVEPVAPPAQPAEPIGHFQKEQEFLHPVQQPVESPLIQPSEPEPYLPPEVKDAGVQSHTSHPQVTDDQKQAGVMPAKATTPVITEPSGLVELPLPEEKALEIAKTQKDTGSSLVWLANLVVFHMKKIHSKLKA